MGALFFLLSLVCLGICGLIVFVIYYIQAFQAAGQNYDYSCPLSAMWAGLATMWYAFLFSIWWLLSYQVLKRAQNQNTAVRIWTFFSGLFFLEGVASVAGWALAENEDLAAGWSSMWIASGILGIVLCRVLLYGVRRERSAEEDQQIVAPPVMQAPEIIVTDVDEASNIQKTGRQRVSGGTGICSCCCTALFWVDLISLFLMACLTCFSTAYTIQSIRSAADAKSLTPPGQIYTVPIRDGLLVKMHLYCYGSTNATSSDSATTTVIFEHGGGSNHVALLAVADQVQSTYQVRVCLYDRLGYGFTPTLYTSVGDQWRLPDQGIILSKLLDEAGETGPFVCAGHSAGAEQCLWLAHDKSRSEQPQQQVIGVALMDGYPDLISNGAFRPGQPPNLAIIGTTQKIAFWAGATGLTRGFVGNPGPDFVPESSASTITSLYGQVRFWLAQYWDVQAGFDQPEEQRLYKQLQGYQDDQGLYHYGGTLSGARVLVMPAYETVTALDCDGDNNGNEYCCGPAKDSDPWCQNLNADKELYHSQAELYASTLSNDTVGLVLIAPKGSAHDFVYHGDYYQWVARQIGEQLLSSNVTNAATTTNTNNVNATATTTNSTNNNSTR